MGPSVRGRGLGASEAGVSVPCWAVAGVSFGAFFCVAFLGELRVDTRPDVAPHAAKRPMAASRLRGSGSSACAAAFCETIEAGGYDAGVYFNQNYVYTFVDRSKLLNWPLWLAQYQSAPDFFYDFSYWQYTDSGSVAGISAPVDLSLRFLPKDNSDGS